MGGDDEFDSSPRPAKKRKVTPAKAVKKPTAARRTSKAKSNDVPVDEFIVPDDDDIPVVKPKRGRPRKVVKDSDDDASVISAPTKRGRPKQIPKEKVDGRKTETFNPPGPVKKSRASKKKSSTTFDSDEDGSVASAPRSKPKSRNQTPLEEYDDDGFAKPQKPKYAIHIPASNELKDVYLDPNAPPPSTNPWEIRGAIWKKDLPAARSVFDVVPAKPPPPPAPAPRPQTKPAVGVVSANNMQRVQEIVVAPAQTNQVRPSLSRFMAPGPAKKQFEVHNSGGPDTTTQSYTSKAAAKPLVTTKPSDIPESDDLDPEDWALFDEQNVDKAAKKPTITVKPSDIPDSDDLDPDDWAAFDPQHARPAVTKPVAAVAKNASRLSSPPKTSRSSATKPLVRSATSVPLSPESGLADDSMMIDDIDPDDWSLLEATHAAAPVVKTAKQAASVPPPRGNIPPLRTVAGQTSTNSITNQIGKAQKPAPGPFIEIEDDSSDHFSTNDIFRDSRRPEATITTSKKTDATMTAGKKPIANAFSTAPLARKKVSQVRNPMPPVSIVDELADLPSDAFDDSDSFSPAKGGDDAVYVSSQRPCGQTKKPNIVAPKNGLVQTTLFGGKTQPQDAVAVATKKHAWPLATQKEPATHHMLDPDAINSWVYPTNLGTIRDYQYNIVARGLFHNLLVALPTGLGKTFIAATIMLNWFRWAPKSQIVFVAPTKPLVAQQIDACFKVVGIPRSETVMLTGETKPAIRAEEWQEKRVFFMTPQTIINDLKHGYCDPKRIVLVVVDEAHRATGGYAYVEVVKFLRRFNQSFRVLALTATPGASVEAVQQVIDGLDISRVEIRTETSIDIRQYVHARDIDTMRFDFSDEQNLVMELLSKAIQPVLNKLNGQNAYWVKDPMKLTAYGCNMAQRQWMADAGKKAPGPIKGMVSQIFPVLASLGHAISLLKFHGIGSFFRTMVNFRNEVDGGQTRGKYAVQIRQDENFNKMMNTIQVWVRNPDFLGHPKLEYLRQVVLNHFMDAKAETRIMIFAHWRDSAEEIVRVMKRNEPMIRPHVFVGQAASKGSDGMGQKRQLEVIQQFKEGKYNTLVATSIGEEGLDIGEVDLIVCYDASSSPIRMLQRMGRTGRKRKGNIVLLVMRGKEDDDFEKAKDNYEKMQGMISDGSRFTFHDDKSPRILPRGTNPVVDKRIVEIPIENSQADLPEPNRRKRVPKKPPKKFHMPDNVRTGFVNASKMDESDEGEETPRPKATKAKAKKATPVNATKTRVPTPEPEGVPLPFLKDVLLNKMQERELERKYQYVNAEDDGVPTVTAPRLDKFTSTFPGPTRLLKHGRRTLAMAGMMQRIHGMDMDRVRAYKSNLRLSEIPSNVDHLLGNAEETLQKDLSADEDLTELPTLPTKRGKQPKATKAKAARSAVTKPASKAKATPKPRKKAEHVRHNSSDMEGDESEPEPTPANMRLGTQGIDLGSDDTMGEEDDDEEPDSQLAQFVVGSDAPIEMVSSSLPRMQDEHSEDNDEVEEVRSASPVRKRLQRRARPVIDDSDE